MNKKVGSVACAPDALFLSAGVPGSGYQVGVQEQERM